MATILVVDDEAVGQTLRGMLEAAGFQVAHATRLPEALATIERAAVDVLVLDLHRGEADGLAVRQVIREQTARAEAEAARAAAEAARQQLHDVFMHVPAMLAVVRGPDHVVELANAAYVQAVGRRDPRELLGQPLRAALPELAGQPFVALLDQVFASGQPYHGHEVPARLTRRGDGRLLAGYLDLLLQPVRTPQGEVDGVVVYAVEVTAYVQARHRAEELDRLKEEFIATASHDLKSPLTSIRGHAQLLLRRLRAGAPDLDRVAQGLAVIDTQVAAMAHLLDALLDASRIQAGGLEVRTAPCDLGACLETVLARLNPEERARVDLTLPDAVVAGEWEQQRIEQVLANLVGNALKYSPASERVSVAVVRRAREIEVAVSDRGMGIPPQELPRLFERFHRTPQALASGLSGTGLGLYIARGAIAAHGGRLWADSPGEGQGATFHFTVPSTLPEFGGRRHPAGRRTDDTPRG